MVAVEIVHLEGCRIYPYFPGVWPQKVIVLQVWTHRLDNFPGFFPCWNGNASMVSIPFIPVSNVVYTDGLEVLEVRAVLKSPSVRRLGLLVLWNKKPSVFDRLEASFLLLCPPLSNDRTAIVLVHEVLLTNLLKKCTVDSIWCQFDFRSFPSVPARA